MLYALLTTSLLMQDPSSVDSTLRTLSLDQKIGQVIMPWLPGAYASVDDRWYQRASTWIDSLEVGGIIVSIGSPLDIAATLNSLQARSKLPLLIAADLEDGTSTRFVGGSAFPSNMGLAATSRPRDAYEQARITAIEARAVGVHMTFSPVADVNNNPANPIINTRSYGEDPRQVAAFVRAYVRGAQDQGLFATAKHFPGHGDTDVDSHLGLPSLDVTWRRLRSVEFVPFQAAIAADVRAIMTAHLAVPRLSGGNGVPATMSASILGDVLRDSLGFGGLVVTDGLSMGAIQSTYPRGEASVRAFEAGSDILLQPPDPRAAFDALREAVQSGRITEARLDQSVRKVLAAKAQAGLFDRRLVPLDEIPRVVGRADHRALAMDVMQRSITLAKDEGVLERVRPGKDVAVVTYGPDWHPRIGQGLAAEFRSAGKRASLFRVWPAAGPASYDSVRTLANRSDVVIIVAAVRPRESSPEIGLPDSLARLVIEVAARKPTILVSLGNPYLYGQVPAVGAYVLGWRPVDEAEIAVARALLGIEPISGRLPIGIPPVFPVGHGLDRPARRSGGNR